MGQQAKSRSFLLITLGIVVLLTGVYCCLFYYQLGSYVTAEWWVKNAYNYKEHRSSAINENKIIIISGSNGLFGIDSEALERSMGIPVANLAVHAGLGLDFLYNKIKDNIRQGDIVVMPLEFSYYGRGPNYDEWMVNNYAAWGMQDYLYRLSPFKLAEFITMMSADRLIEGVIKQNGMNPLLSREAVTREVEDLLEAGYEWRGNDYQSLNKWGDILVDRPPTKRFLAEYTEGIDYIDENTYPSASFLLIYRKIEKLVEQHDGELFLTWPVTVRNSKFNLALPEYRESTRNLASSLSKHDIQIQCDPASFHYEIEYFFNTRDHLNKYGAFHRTVNLGLCLKKLLHNDPDREHDISRANQNMEDIPATITDLNVDKHLARQRDLKTLDMALAAYNDERITIAAISR